MSMGRLFDPQTQAIVEYPSAAVGKFRDDQIAQRSTWAGVPESELLDASMHVIHQVPLNGSTITEVNPLDPGTVGNDGAPCWRDVPHAYGHLVTTRRP